MRCERGLGQFQLSWNTKPMQSQMVIHGTKGVLRVDLFAMFLGRRSATPLPKAAERVVNAYAESFRSLMDVPRGAWKFLRREVQAFQGLRDLVADFYRRLGAGEAPPVSIEDAAVIVEWTEKVARAAEADHAAELARFEPQPAADFLVTGASGSLGSAVVRRLLSEGKRVRVFVRRLPESPIEGVDYRFGNLGDPDAVDGAVAGAERVIHCGAATAGGWPEHYGSTVVGTRNVIESCKRHGVRQLVHISSMSVLDWAGARGRHPQRVHAARAARRGARRVHAVQARGRGGRERRRGRGPARRDPPAGPDLRRRHRAARRLGGPPRRRALADPRRRPPAAPARLHRRRGRRDHGVRSIAISPAAR